MALGHGMAYSGFRKRFETDHGGRGRPDRRRPPWDMVVNNDATFPRIFAFGSLGMGESYMDGWWDCEQLDELIARASRANLKSQFGLGDLFRAAHARLINPKSDSPLLGVGETHYETGRDLYRGMLDRRMLYSCAYWKDAETLDKAQENKLDLIARKLQLEPGMRILDIGCGWGGAIHYFAENYGVTGVAVTISPDQFEAAQELCAGLPVEIRLQDYRRVDEQFDRSYSIDMLGHVGRRNYRTYMETVKRCLIPGGLHLAQTAGSDVSALRADPWVNRYIFPGGHVPVCQAGRHGRRRRARSGRPAQHDRRLRSNLHVLVREPAIRLGRSRVRHRRTPFPDVAVLPVELRRRLPFPRRPTLADPVVPIRRR